MPLSPSSWVPRQPLPRRTALLAISGIFSAFAILTLVGGVILCVGIAQRDASTLNVLGLTSDVDAGPVAVEVLFAALIEALAFFAISTLISLAIEAADNLHRVTDGVVSWDQRVSPD
jgi:hypothetical protein